MKKFAIITLLASLAVAGALFAQEDKANLLKFEEGQERLYKVKWHHYYEIVHPEEGKKKMYVTQAEASVTYKVKKVTAGGPAIGITVTDLKIEKSGDEADKWEGGYDSSKDRAADPGDLMGKEMDLEVDKNGKVVESAEVKSVKYANVFKAVFFGDSLLQASEGLAGDKGTVAVLHDMNSAKQRFKKAEIAHVPFTFTRTADESKSLVTVTGEADATQKVTLAKGQESEMSDVSFSGKVEGAYSTKNNMWDKVTVDLEGKKLFGSDAGEMAGVTVYLRWRIDIEPDNNENTIGVMETNYGKIVMEFYPDKAPKTVKRIRQLIKEGFYDGKTFHRIVPGFCIQGGCPLGNGRGGTGTKIDGEFTNTPYKDGSVGMARAQDPNSNDCQFFITLSRQPNVANLDNKYTLFGQVIEGLDVVHKIEKVPTSNTRPKKEVKIIKFRLKKRK